MWSSENRPKWKSQIHYSCRDYSEIFNLLLPFAENCLPLLLPPFHHHDPLFPTAFLSSPPLALRLHLELYLYVSPRSWSNCCNASHDWRNAHHPCVRPSLCSPPTLLSRTIARTREPLCISHQTLLIHVCRCLCTICYTMLRNFQLSLTLFHSQNYLKTLLCFSHITSCFTKPSLPFIMTR